MTELKSMTKEDLIKLVNTQENELVGMIEIVDEMEETLTCLESRLSKSKGFKDGRKEQVLAILKAGPITVGGIATRVGISARNVSSQLTYLRKDGHEICTSSTGKKFLAP